VERARQAVAEYPVPHERCALLPLHPSKGRSSQLEGRRSGCSGRTRIERRCTSCSRLRNPPPTTRARPAYGRALAPFFFACEARHEESPTRAARRFPMCQGIPDTRRRLLGPSWASGVALRCGRLAGRRIPSRASMLEPEMDEARQRTPSPRRCAQCRSTKRPCTSSANWTPKDTLSTCSSTVEPGGRTERS